MKTSIRIAGLPSQDLNPGPPKHEAGVLTTRQGRSVTWRKGTAISERVKIKTSGSYIK
jgi:hypothetical protein